MNDVQFGRIRAMSRRVDARVVLSRQFSEKPNHHRFVVAHLSPRSRWRVTVLPVRFLFSKGARLTVSTLSMKGGTMFQPFLHHRHGSRCPKPVRITLQVAMRRKEVSDE